LNRKGNLDEDYLSTKDCTGSPKPSSEYEGWKALAPDFT
jgi:hypothetical protein